MQCRLTAAMALSQPGEFCRILTLLAAHSQQTEAAAKQRQEAEEQAEAQRRFQELQVGRRSGLEGAAAVPHFQPDAFA